MKPIKSMLLFLGKNFLTGFIIMLWALVALLGVQAFQSLTTNPSNSGNQSLGSPILTKSGWIYDREKHSLQAIANKLWLFSTIWETNMKRVFITSTTYTGNLWGLAGADDKCQTAANSQSLWWTWMAFLSDNTTDFATRYGNTDAFMYLNLNNEPIFKDPNRGFFFHNMYLDNTTDYARNRNITTEQKTRILPNSSQRLYWTYTTFSWIKQSTSWNYACANWTNATNSTTYLATKWYLYWVNDENYTGLWNYSWVWEYCGSSLSLFCVER